MDSLPQQYRKRSVTTPRRYKESLSPSHVGTGIEGPFITNDNEMSFPKEVWDASGSQRTLNPTKLRE